MTSIQLFLQSSITLKGWIQQKKYKMTTLVSKLNFHYSRVNSDLFIRTQFLFFPTKRFYLKSRPLKCLNLIFNSYLRNFSYNTLFRLVLYKLTCWRLKSCEGLCNKTFNPKSIKWRLCSLQSSSLVNPWFSVPL